MPFSIEQIVMGIILVSLGAIVATEVNRNNSLSPANTAIPAQSFIAATPLATSTPVVKTNSVATPTRNTSSSDPVIDCNFPHSGTLRVTQSKCDSMTDCEISSGKWQPVFKKDCEALHGNNVAQPSANTGNQLSNSNQQTKLYYSKLLGISYTCNISATDAINSAETAYFDELSTRDQCYEKTSNDKTQCITSCSTKHSESLKNCDTAFDGQSCLDFAWNSYQFCQKTCDSILSTSETCTAYSKGFLDSYSKQVKDLIKENCN